MEKLKTVKRIKSQEYRLDTLANYLRIPAMESNLWPGHKERMKNHTKRVQAEMRKYRTIARIIKSLFRRAREALEESQDCLYLLDKLKETKTQTLRDIRKAYL